MSTEEGSPRGRHPSLWLIADASLAALLAAPAEALLLFLLSPDRALTVGDFLATLLAILPQVLVLFVLTGPALVLLGTALSVGRTTQVGISARYVLRFALLDIALLALTAWRQWLGVGQLLPARAQIALALMATSLGLTALVLSFLALVDLRRPNRIGAPWLVATALGLLVALGGAAEIRRVKYPPAQARSLPGLAPSRPLLLIEMPALDPADLERYLERGLSPALDRLAQGGQWTVVRWDGPISDSVALHASLTTGRPVPDHGLFGEVRYQALGDRYSFAVLPRGLFLRPLLRTRLWERIPVDHSALRVVALPDIAAGLGLDYVLVGDPLGFEAQGPAQWIVPEADLEPGARVSLGEGLFEPVCADPGDVGAWLFDRPADELAERARLGEIARRSLARDLCALAVARQALAARGRGIVHLRLSGYYDVAWHFAGYREGRSARGVGPDEEAAFSRVLLRYQRELSAGLDALLAASHEDTLVALVSPHGIRARQDALRVLDGVLGRRAPTGTHAWPQVGLLLLSGRGVPQDGRVEGWVELESVLPTLLRALGLPVAGDMGRPEERLLSTEALEAPITLPSYALPTGARPSR